MHIILVARWCRERLETGVRWCETHLGVRPTPALLVTVIGAFVIATLLASASMTTLTKPPDPDAPEVVQRSSAAPSHHADRLEVPRRGAEEGVTAEDYESEHGGYGGEVVQARHVQQTNIATQRGIWRANNALVKLQALQLLLAFATALGLLVTLALTRTASKAAVGSANAAAETLAATREAERGHAWPDLSVQFSGDSPDATARRGEEGLQPNRKAEFTITYVVTNHGRTPITDVSVEISREQIDAPPKPAVELSSSTEALEGSQAFLASDKWFPVYPRTMMMPPGSRIEPPMKTLDFVFHEPRLHAQKESELPQNQMGYGDTRAPWTRWVRLGYTDLFGRRHWIITKNVLKIDIGPPTDLIKRAPHDPATGAIDEGALETVPGIRIESSIEGSSDLRRKPGDEYAKGEAPGT